MNDEFKTFAPAPELTLEPFKEEMQTPVPAPEKQEIMDESILTDDERRTVDQFASQIDLTNSTMILQYGAGTQKKMADFSETAMENVKTKDLGEVGDLLSGVVKDSLGSCSLTGINVSHDTDISRVLKISFCHLSPSTKI